MNDYILRCAGVWWLMDKFDLVSCSSRFEVSSLDRAQQRFAGQIATLSRGAEEQLIIGVMAAHAIIASLATLATSVKSFASVLWKSDVGLVWRRRSSA